MSTMTKDNFIPIRSICSMHGINPNTLRTWERRYGLIKPLRGTGGQRGYSSADIAVIGQMMQLLESGLAPGEAAKRIRKPKERSKDGRRELQLRKDFAIATRNFAMGDMAGVCLAAEKKLGYQSAVETVLFPEMQTLGEVWHKSPLGIAQEHCATLTVSSFLIDRLGKSPKSEKPIMVVFACVPEEQHHLSILHLANLVAESGGLKPVVLAAGLPLEETFAAIKKIRPQLLVLSSTLTPTSAIVRQWADTIIRAGWERKTLLAGNGFKNSRIFSETHLRPAAGTYSQIAEMIKYLCEAGT